MEHHDDTRRSSTGVPGLDDVLHGGLIEHRLYLIDGNPGAGKTTLALQFLREGVRVGERCLYITLSETRDELLAGAASHAIELDGVEIEELVGHEGELDGEAELTMYHPSEVELTETTRQVLQAVQRVNPSRMVFDSLSELRLLANSSLRYRRQILALKQFFAARRCTVLLLDDRTAEGPDLQLQSIAHGVIALEQRAPPYGQAQRQLRVVKFRGSDFRSGFHDMAIRRGGLQVFARLAAVDHGNDFQRDTVPSGVAALDALLGGGIDRGTTTLLIGPPGSGKSTVALQYAHAAAARGAHAAVFAFDESRAILLARCAGLGMPLVAGTGAGQVHVRQIDPAEIAPGEFAALVREAVEASGARVIVIDSLNGYLNAMPDGRFLTAQLHELLSYLNNHGVATFLVAAQSGVLSPNMQAPVDASYLADTVIMLRMFEHEGRVKKAISVLKKRSGCHEETIRQIWFDGDGVHLSAPLTRLRGVLAGVPVEDSLHAEGPIS
ncbi:ATPase domain-containing protein [uncultured Azohydromonas sp.]|jgi:RecA-superfamily ATPases implicated in signal transduction|uniref:ATPase domain-containing protein n=1 Tax=uncultured Azohydromonas sp. TaxID=487342 RepID=UPI00262E3038|nr:ATPase domain-containing protein [uncultured Azohydromonas sp.]